MHVHKPRQKMKMKKFTKINAYKNKNSLKILQN